MAKKRNRRKTRQKVRSKKRQYENRGMLRKICVILLIIAITIIAANIAGEVASNRPGKPIVDVYSGTSISPPLYWPGHELQFIRNSLMAQGVKRTYKYMSEPFSGKILLMVFVLGCMTVMLMDPRHRIYRGPVTALVLVCTAWVFLPALSNCAGGQGTQQASITRMPQPGVVYFLDDHQGNTHLVTDSLGNVIHEESRYPYGVKRHEENTATNSEAVEESKSYYSYTGKEYDEETGLIYFGGRYYAPEIGRWITPDPFFLEKEPQKSIERPFELNLYSYVRNNPMTFVDAQGLKLEFAKGVSEEYKAQFNMAVAYLKEAGLGNTIDYLKNHKKTIWLHEISDHGLQFDASNPKNLKIAWNPKSGLDVARWPRGVAYDVNSTGSSIQTPALGLLHEMWHAAGYLQGKMKSQQDMPGNPYENAEEARVIMGHETPGARKCDEPMRYSYHGEPVEVLNSTSHVPAHRY